mmetsp:Transcript_36375/g.95527  ORF Transcript_36375/g.95527 Transcript_36375/m.95527 type:complete len:271 (-) Transcript_36375:3907-4719(-)
MSNAQRQVNVPQRFKQIPPQRNPQLRHPRYDVRVGSKDLQISDSNEAREAVLDVARPLQRSSANPRTVPAPETLRRVNQLGKDARGFGGGPVNSMGRVVGGCLPEFFGHDISKMLRSHFLSSPSSKSRHTSLRLLPLKAKPARFVFQRPPSCEELLENEVNKLERAGVVLLAGPRVKCSHPSEDTFLPQAGRPDQHVQPRPQPQQRRSRPGVSLLSAGLERCRGTGRSALVDLGHQQPNVPPESQVVPQPGADCFRQNNPHTFLQLILAV